jgi:hypothetical protein
MFDLNTKFELRKFGEPHGYQGLLKSIQHSWRYLSTQPAIPIRQTEQQGDKGQSLFMQRKPFWHRSSANPPLLGSNGRPDAGPDISFRFKNTKESSVEFVK